MGGKPYSEDELDFILFLITLGYTYEQVAEIVNWEIYGLVKGEQDENGWGGRTKDGITAKYQSMVTIRQIPDQLRARVEELHERDGTRWDLIASELNEEYTAHDVRAYFYGRMAPRPAVQDGGRTAQMERTNSNIIDPAGNERNPATESSPEISNLEEADSDDNFTFDGLL